MRLSLTLDEIYPADTVFLPRVSWRWNRWVATNPAVADFSAALAMVVSGSQPTFVPRAALSPRVHHALHSYLPPIPHAAAPYFDHAEYLERTNAAIEAGSTIALTYPVPGNEIPASRCYVDPSLLGELGDKSLLAEWVGSAAPPRDVVPIDDLVARAGPRLPVAVKVVSSEPAAGGRGVRWCRTPDELEMAQRAMASCHRVVVENWIACARTECLNYLVASDGSIRYLGTARQILSGVRFHGSVADGAAPNRKAVDTGIGVMRRAAERGYVGLAGIDCGTQPDGRFCFFDLNCRINGSTPLILLRDSMLDVLGPHEALLASWVSIETFDRFVDAVRSAADRGWLLPLVIFDPDASPWEAPFMLQAILVGNDEREISDRARRLSGSGLIPLFPYDLGVSR